MLPSPAPRTFADHLAILGGLPPSRVRVTPPPGTATVADWESATADGALCELVDGTLVDKAMGWYESLVASVLIGVIREASQRGRLGVVAGEQGFITLPGGIIRAPDVAFYLRANLPGGQLPRDKRPAVVPDLAVEVLSEGNTVAEMAAKRRELFHAGTTVLWIVDPSTRSVAVYTSVTDYQIVDAAGTLSGGSVLPSLSVSIAALFDEVG